MISSLKVKIEQREGTSFLKDAYVTQPFRIVPVGQYKRDKAAHLMIMSSSPGLLDNDDHQLEFNLAPNTRMQLQTQAYQRLYHMENKSTQTTLINLESGSGFSFVPHPVVPQNQSTFISHNKAYLQDDCHFLLSDIITCGRKLSGEEFMYNHFQNLTEIYHHNKLVVKDNVLLQPQKLPIQGMGILEGFTHQGTLIYYNTANVLVSDFIDFFQETYGEQENIEFGISKLEGNGFIIRVLAQGAEKLFEAFQKIQQKVWEEAYL
ncbi:urease accessory protein UreD [Flavobacterium agricola]|uniref:Urease accessory protein UreD n=1 Tax=Flavobacterium agricola TaxID=2870839 RepID=A0ABY6M217_9FLAO|nr:urease accessory protein UreD [Flavobacterium agricola]UYW02297.1 urease accessory protein UreD [Flavobacterium agricola]